MLPHIQRIDLQSFEDNAGKYSICERFDLFLCLQINELYNDYKGTNYASNRAYGAIYDVMLKRRKLLPCPLYHVAPSGNFTAAPNMYKIKYTQQGYGIYTPNTFPNGKDNVIEKVFDCNHKYYSH
jgi:hypothetical protein